MRGNAKPAAERLQIMKSLSMKEKKKAKFNLEVGS